jgi:hypothetical protein
MPATAGKHDSNPFACLACCDDDIRYRTEGIRYRAEADDNDDIRYRVEGSRYRAEADVVRFRAVTDAFRAVTDVVVVVRFRAVTDAFRAVTDVATTSVTALGWGLYVGT